MKSALRIAVAGAALIASATGLGPRSPAPAQAQASAAPSGGVRAVPFGPGERFEYQVRVGLFGNVGDGFLEVAGTEMVRGTRAYKLRFGLQGSALLGTLKVNNLYESWLSVSDLVALRFHQNQHELRYRRNRTFDFHPTQGLWRLQDSDQAGSLGSDRPLDEVSMLYFARTLPLEVGRTYTLNRYFKAESNPVILRVLRRETVTVPAGTFNTIVVQPIIKTDGLFGEGGEAEVYFTDDDRRILVQLKSRMPVLRTLDFQLTRYIPGSRL